MFSLTKTRGLYEVQTPISFVATRYSGEYIEIHRKNSFVSISFPELQLNKPK